MHYVYILKSESEKYYIGCTSDLRRRFEEHNRHGSISTKGHMWKLVYYEAYPTLSAARYRESKLKHHGKGIAEIK